MQLSIMKKEASISLREHAAEVRRLVALFYADLPEVYQQRMVVGNFCNTPSNAYLRRHLLADETPTIEAAVKARMNFYKLELLVSESELP